MIAWDHWHIEPSSICTLKCPRCPRAEVPDSLLNRQLTLKFFQEQIGADTIKHIKKITFCGNDGDPIYCKEFLAICQWIKSVNPNINLVIVTNGSHKPADWWQQLACTLNQHDEINWSIDGWDQTSNEQYRVNSDWNSIHNGLQTFVRNNNTTYRVWAAIGFKFNQHDLDKMLELARSHGMDLFQLTKSTKFGSKYPVYGINDALEPAIDLIASGHRFERQLTALTQRARPNEYLKEIFWHRAQNLTQHAGLCLVGNKGVFLNSQGEFYPCCWTANRYQHNRQWHSMAERRFNLNQRSFADIINDEFWSTDFLKFDSLECTTKCTQEKLKDQEHATEW